jgi:uncharacterized protein
MSNDDLRSSRGARASHDTRASHDARTLCIVIHDVAPATWSACRWLIDTVAQHGRFPVTLLAVPRYHGMHRNAGFERWLRAREAHGDEVALHGFDHLDGSAPRNAIDHLRRRVYTRGEGEFWALDFEEATERLLAGRGWLHEFGITPAGFVAPAWLLGDSAWRALRRQPFDYTCTLRRIHLLDLSRPEARLREIVCQSQVYSSANAWRQQASVVWNETLAWRQRQQQVVRLELHPGDDAPLISRSWERLLREQAKTRRVRTLREVAASIRTAPAPKSR